MPKNLLIVESPAKAKTIEKFLGKDFTVKSSFGHVRDLDKGINGVAVNNDFKPNYVISPEKLKVVKELKESVKKVDEVWLATDEDREGEAISWHLCQVLGLDERTTKRIVFREITKPAIQKAIQNPRHLNLDLVDAQQARRILDRLVGFDLSGVLWKKVKNKLSAGRVQSVAVKLVVEKEREINNHKTVSFYKIFAHFIVKNEQNKNVILKAEMPERFSAIDDAKSFLQKCIGAQFSILKIETKPGRRKPSAPFITSTLQQEASRKLGFSVNRTMSNAQRLYEEGHITYMRTDSTTLSQDAIGSIAAEISRLYGGRYVQSRQYATKSANAQEAHEAIRPTYIERQVVSQDRDLQRLYDLIWKRTISSQMADAELEKTTVDIGISTIKDAKLLAIGEVLKFDGFLKVYMESKDDDEDDDNKEMLPPLKVGQNLTLDEMNATERFTRPASRYTEASLVKKLEELGIGRPSTYAPTISKIMEEGRGYVVKENKEGVVRPYNILILKNNQITKTADSEITGATKNVLCPTDMGMLVVDFLDEHFKEIMNYSFTAKVEGQFDEISLGVLKYQDMLKKFYTPFNSLVSSTVQNAERVSGERILGKHPESGKTVLVRMSRFGPVVQLGTTEELGEEKPQYANLKAGQSLENVDLEGALELFKLPKELGTYEGENISVGAGRYGPYIKYKESFISLPKNIDPLNLDLEQAINIIKEKIQEDAPLGEYQGKPFTKGKGRFGPFIKWDSLYVNIPRAYDVETITAAQAISLIEAKIEKESNRYIQNWDKEKISIENGRWGPYIRFGKNNIKLPKLPDGTKMQAEHCASLSLEDVKKIIEAEIPNAFEKKGKK
ncbi:MAG: type I DNA topoisomerase [Saprospiraceae bacterium]|nr:type I DNA topoisomerase [Saprospiraceae bacterium]